MIIWEGTSEQETEYRLTYIDGFWQLKATYVSSNERELGTEIPLRYIIRFIAQERVNYDNMER